MTPVQSSLACYPLWLVGNFFVALEAHFFAIICRCSQSGTYIFSSFSYFLSQRFAKITAGKAQVTKTIFWRIQVSMHWKCTWLTAVNNYFFMVFLSNAGGFSWSFFLNLFGLIPNLLTLFFSIRIILHSSMSRKFRGFWLDNVMKGLLTVTSVTMILST